MTATTNEKIKVLYYGDGPQVATGFATVTRNILMPMYETGRYDITVLGINYHGEPHEFPFPTWPVNNNPERDPYGRKFIQERIMNIDFDILFMVQDSFILEFIKDMLPQLKMAGKKFKSVVYFPIDGVPKPSWVEAMAEADYPVTYTSYGKKECMKAFPPIAEKLSVIPHGVNVDDYYPISYGEDIDFRNNFFGPLASKFIVSMINRNQQRKDVPRAMVAFKKFKERCPESMLYLHMAIQDMGWNLAEVAKSIGLKMNSDIVFPSNFSPNKGFPVNILNKIYNCSDVVISSTTGEGWGLAQVEAMATKTPIISPDNTSCSEIVGEDRGLLVRSGHDIEHFTVLPNDNEVLRPIISIQDMTDKLELLYNDEVLRMRLGETGHDYIHSTWLWDKHIVPQWMDIIDKAVESLSSESEDEYCFSGAMEV